MYACVCVWDYQITKCLPKKNEQTNEWYEFKKKNSQHRPNDERKNNNTTTTTKKKTNTLVRYLWSLATAIEFKKVNRLLEKKNKI